MNAYNKARTEAVLQKARMASNVFLSVRSWSKITWFDRAVMWASQRYIHIDRQEIRREWQEVAPKAFTDYQWLRVPQRVRSNGCHGGAFYTLSSGQVIFAETLSQWGL